MSCIVIAGTDTGVGKTFVACGVAQELISRGQSVIALKPVETGCTGWPPGDHEDGVVLARATGQLEPRRALHRFQRPLAPALAAELEGRNIGFAALVARTRMWMDSAEVVLLEGAGGLLSPFSWSRSLLDLSLALQASVLLVGADRLGCLNHLLLAWREVPRAGIAVKGIVLCEPAAPDQSTGTNAASLRKLIPDVPVAVIARGMPGALQPFAQVASWLGDPVR